MNLFRKIEEIEYIPTPKPIMDTAQEKFIKICIESLDTEVTPLDEIPDDVACAQTVTTLIRKVFPDFPILPSTADLFKKLKTDKRFKATLTPQKGTIVVSPRTPTIFGHTGVFITDDRIASNDSNTGIFRGNYTWPATWIDTFGNRGLHTYLFQINI